MRVPLCVAVGIWNERGYTTDYIDILRQTLDGYGFPDTNIVAHDAGWDIANDVLNNASVAQAVDVIGVHVRRAEWFLSTSNLKKI